jgi:P2 family phage contractile tail tube protein
MLTEQDPGSWKAGEANETKFSIGCTYYKLEIDGAVIYDLDPINGIRIINGVDQTAAERAAIGM